MTPREILCVRERLRSFFEKPFSLAVVVHLEANGQLPAEEGREKVLERNRFLPCRAGHADDQVRGVRHIIAEAEGEGN